MCWKSQPISPLRRWADGHWPNPESCSSYFHCANGRPYEGNCPAGLLWNGLKSECDFPENVNCDISLGEAAKLKVAKGSYVYMTFDDGPNEGTPYVLDALKEVREMRNVLLIFPD